MGWTVVRVLLSTKSMEYLFQSSEKIPVEKISLKNLKYFVQMFPETTW